MIVYPQDVDWASLSESHLKALAQFGSKEAQAELIRRGKG